MRSSHWLAGSSSRQPWPQRICRSQCVLKVPTSAFTIKPLLSVQTLCFNRDLNTVSRCEIRTPMQRCIGIPISSLREGSLTALVMTLDSHCLQARIFLRPGTCAVRCRSLLPVLWGLLSAHHCDKITAETTKTGHQLPAECGHIYLGNTGDPWPAVRCSA